MVHSFSILMRIGLLYRLIVGFGNIVTPASGTSVAADSPVVTLSSSEFDAKVGKRGGGGWFVMLHVNWCGICRHVFPLFEATARHSRDLLPPSHPLYRAPAIEQVKPGEGSDDKTRTATSGAQVDWSPLNSTNDTAKWQEHQIQVSEDAVFGSGRSATGFTFAHVDCTDDKVLAKRFQIPGYPALLYWDDPAEATTIEHTKKSDGEGNNEDQDLTGATTASSTGEEEDVLFRTQKKYKGSRSIVGFRRFARRMSARPVVHRLTGDKVESGLRQLVAAEKSSGFVYRSAAEKSPTTTMDSGLYKAFSELAWKHRDEHRFYHLETDRKNVDGPEILSKFAPGTINAVALKGWHLVQTAEERANVDAASKLRKDPKMTDSPYPDQQKIATKGVIDSAASDAALAHTEFAAWRYNSTAKKPKVSQLEDWVTDRKYPGVWNVSGQTFGDIVRGERPALLIVTPNRTEETAKELDDMTYFRKLEKSYEGSGVYLGVLEGSEYAASLEAMSIYSDQLPRVWFVQDNFQSWYEDPDLLTVRHVLEAAKGGTNATEQLLEYISSRWPMLFRQDRGRVTAVLNHVRSFLRFMGAYQHFAMTGELPYMSLIVVAVWAVGMLIFLLSVLGYTFKAAVEALSEEEDVPHHVTQKKDN
ncbi:unnamed protein product [Amoebophrya sp. A25]|nr:unnamed protein product [Amoebophrya sp. A25]|eukprot:GSA25T00000416001.1